METQRALFTLAELSDWMTTRLQALEDCEGSTVTVQYRLQKPDAEGCNWSETVVCSPGPNASKELLLGHVAHLVQEARGKFNVRD